VKPRRFGYALALLLLGAPRAASAFCPAMTCDPSDASQRCEVDQRTKCVTSGQPLFWSSECVTFSIQKDAAPRAGIDYAAVKASVERAFDAWTSVDCNGKSPSLHLTLSDPVSCAASEYSKDHHNANIVVFREDEWPYEGGEDALGLTRVRFDPDNNVGELYDTDIEINAVSEPLSVGDPKADEVDLDSLLTHEMGHALGLGHSLDIGATMLAGYAKGSVAPRTLGDDDIAGVCSIYPPGRKPGATSCEPRHGFSELCSADQPALATPPAGAAGAAATEDTPHQSSSCSMAPAGVGRTERGSWWALVPLAFAAAGLARRRRRSGAARGTAHNLLRVLFPALLSLCALAFPQPAQAETQPSFLYLLSNAPAAPNAIAAYRVDSAGAVSPIVGSPFATGGSGLASVTGAEYAHRVAVSRSSNRLFAANELDGSIAVFNIDKLSGALTQVAGSPFAVAEWAGNPGTSLSVSIDGQFLYGSNTSVLSFRVAANGALSQVGARWVFSSRVNGMTVAEANDALYLAMSDRVTVLKVGSGGLSGLPPTNYSLGNVPTDVAVNHAGNTLYVGSRSGINAFHVSAGSLTPLAGTPFFGSTSNLSGLTLDYYERALVAYGFSGPTLAAGVLGSDGGVTPGLNSPLTPGVAPSGAALSPDGQRLFVSNNASQLDAWLLDTGTLVHAPGYPVTVAVAAGFSKVVTFPVQEATPSPALPFGASALLGLALFGATWARSRKLRCTSS
jgi:DNA-binding beta-propeller fold protein YncE